MNVAGLWLLSNVMLEKTSWVFGISILPFISSLQSTLQGAQFSGWDRAEGNGRAHTELWQLQGISMAGAVTRVVNRWCRVKGRCQHSTPWWHDDKESGSKCCLELRGSGAGCQHGGNLSAGRGDPDCHQSENSRGLSRSHCSRRTGLLPRRFLGEGFRNEEQGRQVRSTAVIPRSQEWSWTKKSSSTNLVSFHHSMENRWFYVITCRLCIIINC